MDFDDSWLELLHTATAFPGEEPQGPNVAVSAPTLLVLRTGPLGALAENLRCALTLDLYLTDHEGSGEAGAAQAQDGQEPSTVLSRIIPVPGQTNSRRVSLRVMDSGSGIGGHGIIGLITTAFDEVVP